MFVLLLLVTATLSFTPLLPLKPLALTPNHHHLQTTFCERRGGASISSYKKKNVQKISVEGVFQITASNKNNEEEEEKTQNGNKQYKNDNDATKSIPTTEREIKMLHWNLNSLLSTSSLLSNQKEKIVIALLTVYRSAKLALRKQNSSPLVSLDYNGALPNDQLEKYRLFIRKYNYDIGHDARFTINSQEGASIQSDLVFCMDHPLSFIRDSLTYKGKNQHTTSSFNSGSIQQQQNEEVVVFVPGLHTTCHQLTSNNKKRRTSMDRLKYYSKVLDGLPMAQIHVGTFIDQVYDDGNNNEGIMMELNDKTLQILESSGLLLTEEDDRDETMRQGPHGNETSNVKCYLDSKDLDIIRTVLSSCTCTSSGGDSIFDLIKDEEDCETQKNQFYSEEENKNDVEKLKQCFMKLIDIAVMSSTSGTDQNNTKRKKKKKKKKEPHLVLMVYSATSNILASALAQWKQEVMTYTKQSSSILQFPSAYYCNYNSSNKKKQRIKQEEIEQLLHRSITIVTIGTLTSNFVKGPAYIHLSMCDDPLTSTLGITQKTTNNDNAVFLHGISPYYTEEEKKNRGIYTNNAHNMDACLVQYLAIIRRINGIPSFRKLYNLAADVVVKTSSTNRNEKEDINPSLFAINYDSMKVGELATPPDIDDSELLPSMIRATGGERWLFDTLNKNYEQVAMESDTNDGLLPSYGDAESFIENQFGYNVYDEIVEACCDD